MLRIIVLLLFSGCCIAAPGIPVKEDLAVRIGGIDQWISIRGTNADNPVLLFLHGGPGNSAMGYSDKFSDTLQKYFVVVQWDQRESGKTGDLNASDQPLSVALMESDVVEMIRYLQHRFSREKICLMGHSWGGFLGLKVAADHADLLESYFAVCPMIDQLESERMSLQWMMGEAKARHNEKALQELSEVRIPFQNGDQLFYHRNWLARLSGNTFPSKEFVVTWAEKWLPLFNEASAINFFQIAPEIKCPVYFFVGGKDYQTHFALTEKYFKTVKAPKKEIFWFEESGHNLHVREARKFQQAVIDVRMN